MVASKTREVLWSVLQDIPDDLVDEVADLVQILRLRHVVPDTAMLFKAGLAAAWLTPDEDEAWKSLWWEMSSSYRSFAKRCRAFVLAELPGEGDIFARLFGLGAIDSVERESSI